MFGISFGKKTNSPHHVLIISIRNTVISLGLVDISKDTKKIIYTTKESLLNSDFKSLDTILKRMINEAFVKLASAGNTIKIQKVKIVLNASFYEVYIKDLTIEKDKEFVLTKEQFKNSIEKHSEIVSAEKEGKFVLERDVTNVLINGYEISDPFNKPTKKLSVSFYASFVDKKIIEDIQKIIQDNIHVKKIEFSTFYLNKFKVMRNIFLNANNYLSLDIGEKYTDIAIIENNSIKHRDYFDIGYKDIVDEVNQKCFLNNNLITESAINMAIKGEIDQNCNQEVINALKEKQKKWVDRIATELKDNQGLNIPAKVFISSEDKISNLFYKSITDPLTKTSLFPEDKNLTVINLNNNYFKKHVIYGENVETDIFLTLIAINLEL